MRSTIFMSPCDVQACVVYAKPKTINQQRANNQLGKLAYLSSALC